MLIVDVVILFSVVAMALVARFAKARQGMCKWIVIYLIQALVVLSLCLLLYMFATLVKPVQMWTDVCNANSEKPLILKNELN